MFVVSARLTVDPDRIDEFERLAHELWTTTHRLEPGCRRYEYLRLPRPGSYLAWMVFDDHDAFLDHQASAHHTDIAAGAMRTLLTDVTLEFGETVDGAFGTIDEGDEPAPGSLDVDPSLRAWYADRMPAPDFGDWPG